jgi:hypothetical protein
MATEIISSELDMSAKVHNHSTVIYRNISPQGSNSVTLAASLSSPVEFVIAPSCFNGAKSRLNFQIKLTTSGTKYNFINANTFCSIGRMTAYDSASGAVLMDISNFEKYAQLVVPVSTHIDDFLTKSNAIAIPAATSGASTPFAVEDLTRVNGTTNLDSSGTSVAAYNSYTGKREWYLAGAGAAFLDVSLPLGAIKFAAPFIDKLQYSPSNIVLQVYFNAVDQFLIVSNSATDPAAATQTSAAGSIENISLSLANEGNLAIVSQVIGKVMSGGVNLTVPYSTCIRQAVANTTSVSYQLSLSRAYGNRLLFLATGQFTPNQGGTTTASAYISRNNYHPRGDLTQLNSFLNGVAIKYPAGFDCSKSQDYTLGNKEYLKRSTIQTAGEYLLSNWGHYDCWTGERPICEIDPTIVDGLDISSQNSTWSIQATLSTASTATFVNVLVGQKVMSLTSAGIQMS